MDQTQLGLVVPKKGTIFARDFANWNCEEIRKVLAAQGVTNVELLPRRTVANGFGRFLLHFSESVPDSLSWALNGTR